MAFYGNRDPEIILLKVEHTWPVLANLTWFPLPAQMLSQAAEKLLLTTPEPTGSTVVSAPWRLRLSVLVETVLQHPLHPLCLGLTAKPPLLFTVSSALGPDTILFDIRQLQCPRSEMSDVWFDGWFAFLKHCTQAELIIARDSF